MQRCFITATDTDAGKTWVIAWLTKALNARQSPTLAIKPIASGCTAESPESRKSITPSSLHCADTALLNQVNPPPLMEQLGKSGITPYRYEAYCSPARAIATQGDAIDLTDIQRFCESIPSIAQSTKQSGHFSRFPRVLIEGAGGVLSPIVPGKTNADLIQALKIPALLVVPNQIGCINHTLLSIQALQKQHIPLAGIVTTATEPSNLADNLEELRQWLKSTEANQKHLIPLMSLPYVKHWQDMPQYHLDELSNWFLNLEFRGTSKNSLNAQTSSLGGARNPHVR